MNAFTKHIISLIDKNDLSQLKMVLNKAALTDQKHKINWEKLMQHCARHDRIDAMDMIEARGASSLNGNKEPYLWKVALRVAQSSNMANHILDQLEHFVSDCQPLSTLARLEIVAMGIDAIKVVVERCNFQNDRYSGVIDDGLLWAVDAERLDVVDLFLPLVSDTFRTRMLTRSCFDDRQPLIDHLYTLERAQATLEYCASQVNWHEIQHYPGIVYLQNKVGSELTKQAIESHIDLSGMADPSSSKPKM